MRQTTIERHVKGRQTDRAGKAGKVGEHGQTRQDKTRRKTERERARSGKGNG